MLIRSASAADVPSLVPLFAQWGHPLAPAAVAQVVAEWAGTPRARILLAELDGQVVGLAAVSAGPRLSGPGRYAHLAGLVVGSTHRRHGVGAALLAAAETQAREWGCTSMELTSNLARDAAHRFYPARGYEETSGHHARYVRGLAADPP